MRRLKHPNNVLHFPTLTIADAGIYIDAKLSKGILSFKKDGVNIPGYSDIDGDGTAFATGCKGTVAYTDDGIFKSRLLTFNAPGKAEDIYYDFGLTIQTLVKLPGVGTRHTNRFEKTYGGTLDVVETSGGYVTDAYKLLMEDQILDNITNDVAIHNQETDPRVKFAGAIVDGFRVYTLEVAQEDLSGTNVVVTYSPADGGSDVTCTFDQATHELNLNAVNTDLASEPCQVFAGSNTTYFFVATTAGDKFTISTAVSTYSGTTTRQMMLVAKDEEVNFDVEFIGKEWTAQTFGILHHTYVGTGNMIQIVNGTKETIVHGANAAAAALDINTGTAGAALLVWAAKELTASTTYDIVQLPGKVTSIHYQPLDATYTTVQTTNYLRCSGTGKYPSLSSDEVFKVVFNKKDGGRLSAMQRLDQPAADTTYAKYVLTYTGFEIYGEALASETSSYVNEVIIYVPKTVAQTNVWDATDMYIDYGSSNPGAADTSFEAMLWMWCDLAVGSW